MRTPDLDRARSEKNLSLAEFVKVYNEDLPATFPRASVALLKEFTSANTGLFKVRGVWSLNIHRKKVMDWLRTNAV